MILSETTTQFYPANSLLILIPISIHREKLLKDVDLYKDDPVKLQAYAMRARLDMVLFHSSKRFGQNEQGGTYNLLGANIEGQHRAVAVFLEMLRLPLVDVSLLPFNLTNPHLRKEMRVYRDSGIPITNESQVFMPVPFNTCKYTNDIPLLRAFSNELAKTTQEASGSSDYGALTTTAKFLMSLSESGRLVHATRENVFKQETVTVEGLIKNVRNATAAGVISVLTKSSKWTMDHLDFIKLKKVSGSDTEKINRIHEDVKLLMVTAHQNRPDDDEDLDELNIGAHIPLKVCYGNGCFETPGTKSNLCLTTKLRGIMEELSYVALSKEALSDFERVLQIDPKIAEKDNLELIRAMTLHVAAIVAGEVYIPHPSYVGKKMRYPGLIKGNLNHLPDYQYRRLKINLYWNAIAQVTKDVYRLAMRTEGFKMKKASMSAAGESQIVNLYHKFIEFDEDDSDVCEMSDDVLTFKSLPWDSKNPPKSLLAFILLTYPEALKYKAKELQTTEIKKLMESTTNKDKLKWTSFPPNSEDTRKGRGICRIQKFDCDDDIVYIPKQFRLYDWAMSFLLADDDAPVDPSRAWIIPTTRSTDESKRPSSRPLPLAKNGE